MTQLDVQLNLDAQINSFVTAFPIDVVYSNTDYSPKEGTDYLFISYINGDVFQIAPVEGSYNRTTVILQMDLYSDADIGKYRIKEVVDAMQPYFKRGTVIHNNDIYTRVTNFVVADLTEEANKSLQVIRVSTRSDYQN